MHYPTSSGVIAGVLVTFAAVSLHAQDSAAKAAEPPTPASVEQLPILGRSVAPAEQTPAYRAFSDWYADGYAVVTILTPRSLAGITGRDSLTKRIRECDPRYGSKDSAAIVIPDIPRVWAPLDSATAGRAFVLLQVEAPIAPAAQCAIAQDLSLSVAGVQLANAGARMRPRNDVIAVTVTRGGRAVAPAIAARASEVVLGRGMERTDARPGALRIYLHPDALGPDARGRFPAVVLWLATGDSTRRDSLRVPDSLVVAIWRDFTPWRVDRLPAAATAADLPRLREPGDTALRRAAALYAAGDIRGAAALAARGRERLPATQPRSADARFAELLLGSVFLAQGDSDAGRAEYRASLAGAPCLRLASHPDFDRVLGQVRSSRARCTSVPVGKQFLSGLLFPGGAQWAQRNRVGAGVASAVTATLFASAIRKNAQAQRQFDAYRQAVPPAPIAPLLDRANATRRSARQEAFAAITAWGASAAIGLVTEAWHAHRVAREQRYEPPVAGGGAQR